MDLNIYKYIAIIIYNIYRHIYIYVYIYIKWGLTYKRPCSESLRIAWSMLKITQSPLQIWTQQRGTWATSEDCTQVTATTENFGNLLVLVDTFFGMVKAYPTWTESLWSVCLGLGHTESWTWAQYLPWMRLWKFEVIKYYVTTIDAWDTETSKTWWQAHSRLTVLS